MKKILLVLLFWTIMLPIVTTAAQTADDPSRAPQAIDWCEIERKALGAPYYYCPCKQNTMQFSFPLDMEINDTIWFTAEVSDLQKGLSAYWLANCNVQMEVYAFCSSKTPTISMAVGPNQMREMDVTNINKKLAEMGEMAKLLQETLTPHIRVYPIGSGSGRVICYPYDQGPHSECGNPMNVINGMTFVSSNAEDVYKLQNKSIVKNRKMYVQWKQKKNEPCTLTVRRNSCSGEVLATTTLTDSTKLYFPSLDMLNQVKTAGDSLYFCFSHDAEKVGRVQFRYNPKFITLEHDTTLCQGKGLELMDTILTETTIYVNDTTWLKKDSVGIHTYNVTITPAPLEYDTIRVKSTQLPMLYADQGYIAKDGYGDYDFMLSYADDCDRHVKVNVVHQIDTIREVAHQTICQGKTYKSGGVTYSTDTDINDSVYTNPDTYSIRDVHIHFTAPDTVEVMEYVTSAQMTEGYYYKGQLVEHFGEIQLTIVKKNTCTEVVNLNVVEKISTDVQNVNIDHDNNVSRMIMRNGRLYVIVGKRQYTLLGELIE